MKTFTFLVPEAMEAIAFEGIRSWRRIATKCARRVMSARDGSLRELLWLEALFTACCLEKKLSDALEKNREFMLEVRHRLAAAFRRAEPEGGSR